MCWRGWGASGTVGIEEGLEEEGSGDLVAGEGDVPEDGDAEEGFDVGVVGLSGEGVPEEEEGVELFFGEMGTDLEVAAHGAAEVAVDGAVECCGEETSGGAGGGEGVRGEGVGVALGPCDELVFAVVVSDEGDAHGGGHGEEGRGRVLGGKGQRLRVRVGWETAWWLGCWRDGESGSGVRVVGFWRPSGVSRACGCMWWREGWWWWLGWCCG